MNRAMQKAFPATNTKPYWHWRCSCGYDDNRNTDHACKKCGEKITCNTAGGCHGKTGQLCERGCGERM
jgi:hypothetical protein